MITQVGKITQLHRNRPNGRAKPKMRLPGRLALGGLAGLALCLIAAVIAAIVYMLWDDPNMTSRPLVLIHSPINREQLSEGDSVLVHTTARSPAGIQRIELWADDVLIAQRQAEPGTPSESMVLSADWIPLNTGNHRLIARATSVDKVDGQASIAIETIATDEAEAAETHTVQEGETLDTIASAYGTTPDELAAANPGIDPGNPAPGSEVVVPGDEPPAEGESPSDSPLPTDSDPPSMMAEPPSGRFSMPLDRPGPVSDEPTGLRMELVSLQTGAAYEALSCYIGMAGAMPRRYPDTDGNPSTDESFAITSSPGGDDASWNVDEYLAGDSVPTIFWPADQPIPLDIACVGIIGGGTQALQLGHTGLSIPPEQWDGIVRYARATGPEGIFGFGYRVSGTGDDPRGASKYPDPDMNSPTDLVAENYNIVLGPEPSDDGSPTNFMLTEGDPWALLWKYEPNDISIDGFRIYVNGVLQWTERVNRTRGEWHYTVFPPQWRHPPCGEQYVLTVSSWRTDPADPEGAESLPATPEVVFETPRGECDRHVIVTFHTLETFELGSDGHHEERDGDVGPPFGKFFAGDHEVNFDTGTLDHEPFVGYIGVPMGLTDYTVYSLENVAAPNSRWGFEAQPFLIADVPDVETLEVGYRISDEDSGRCHDSDDRGCDDFVCGASVEVDDFGTTQAVTLPSDNGRCTVTFSYELTSDSPVDSPGDTLAPLPRMSIEDITFDDDSEAATFHFWNSGLADWSMQDLTVELQDRDGRALSRYTWRNVSLAAGERTVLEHPDAGLPTGVYDLCALVDPDDAVLEENESRGVYHYPVCPQRPDLTITDVVFEGDASGYLEVTVENVGSEHMSPHRIELDFFWPDGSQAGFLNSPSPVSLDIGESRAFVILVDETFRARMTERGYTVIVNEDNRIAESDTTNNSMTIGPAEQVQITWCRRYVPGLTGETSGVRMYLTAEVQPGSSSRQVMNAGWTHELNEEDVSLGNSHDEYTWDDCPEISLPFTLTGDQWLQVTISAEYRVGDSGDYVPIGSQVILHDPRQYWSAGNYFTFPFTLENALGTRWSTEYRLVWVEP